MTKKFLNKNVFVCHQIVSGGFTKKHNVLGGLLRKGGFGQIGDLKGGLPKKRQLVFLRGD